MEIVGREDGCSFASISSSIVGADFVGLETGVVGLKE